MDLFHELAAFLREVLSQWLSLLGGAAMTAYGYFSDIKGRDPKKKVLKWAGIFFIFCAFFLAWKDVKEKLTTAKSDSEIWQKRAEYRQKRIDHIQDDGFSKKAPSISNPIQSPIINSSTGSFNFDYSTHNGVQEKILPNGQKLLNETASGIASNTIAQINMAIACHKNGDRAGAFSHIKTAIEYENASEKQIMMNFNAVDRGKMFSIAAVLAANLGSNETAYAWASNSIKQTSNDNDILNNAQVLIKLGKLDEAKSYVEKKRRASKNKPLYDEISKSLGITK